MDNDTDTTCKSETCGPRIQAGYLYYSESTGTYTRRWVELSEKYLSVFKNPEDIEDAVHFPIIDLLLVITANTKNNEICLRFKQSVLCLRTDNKEHSYEWMKSIGKASNIPVPQIPQTTNVPSAMHNVDLSSPIAAARKVRESKGAQSSSCREKK